MAVAYAFGDGVDKSHIKSIQILQSLDTRGHLDAKVLLADFYMGQITPRVNRYPKAVRLFEDLIKGSKNADYEFTFRHGKLLMAGYNGKQYFEEGMAKVAEAFAHGHREAADYLAAGLICDNTNCANEAIATCAVCGLARYCSKRCQMDAWKTHSLECQSVEERLKAEKHRELIEEAQDFYDLCEFEMAEKYALEAICVLHAHYIGHLMLAQSRLPQGKPQLLIDDLEAYMNSRHFDSSVSGGLHPATIRMDFYNLAAEAYKILNDSAGLQRTSEKLNDLLLAG